MYHIVRMYQTGKSRVIRRGLNLAQAKKHCRNPETSSKTATTPAAKARTKKHGSWFDGYEQTR